MSDIDQPRPPAKRQRDMSPSRPRRPPKLTRKAMENAALTYLARYETTAGRLEAMLQRRVQRGLRAGGDVPDDVDQIITAVVAKMVDQGYVDDARYARLKASGLLGRGNSPRLVGAKLAHAGVDPEVLKSAIDQLAEKTGADAWTAALALARKRRLGPFRRDQDQTETGLDPLVRRARRQKELAIFARAGFDRETAERVLDTPEEMLP